ncbi:sugar porter family MFS transporter [Haloferula sp. BvORR071]|uniref:sugar porter family MFS transporter n=1 Tax=Haloferula sp. BvORR071 TaxID=1396141 RepID=UPI0005510C44|nr:sugar porter family MFS transporter [Haloferula sp. BvORR071]
MNKLFFWTITSALAGFLFGFDTVVISGAEKKIQHLWGLEDMAHGIAIGSALYGMVLGSLIGGWPTDKFGRKKTLLWIGILYLLSAVGSALAQDVYVFSIARFLGGVGVGISTVASPLFISEIAPPDKRGRLAGMFQFNIVFGIVVAFFSNWALAGTGENAWRWMLGVMAFPSVIYTALCFSLPESPRWLISKKNDRSKAKEVLRQISPDVPDEEIEATVNRISSHSAHGAPSGPFWSKRLRTPIILAFLIAFFNQLSGINAILYFAPRIFEMTGLGEKTAMLTSIGIGVTNLIFTFAGLWLIDRLGRRTLLYIGSFGYILSLGVVSWAFYTQNYSIVPAFIFAFIAAHAIGQGAVIWVFISEIFPNEHRAMGQSLGSATHWVFAALLTTFFPKMVGSFHPGAVFAFFAFMMCLQLLWVKTMVPETKGTALEDMEGQLVRH